MKIYEIIIRKTMIRKDIAEKCSEQELNERFYQFDKYDGNILFYSIEDAMKLYNDLEKNESGIQLVNGFFNLKYYQLMNIEMSELKVDDSIINKEFESFGGLNKHKLEVYENTLVDNIIKEKNYSIKDLKNYIKEGK